MIIISIGLDKFNVPGTIESPGFSVFPVSVQPSLQEAFDNGNYVYREDIAPPPEPDWTGFNIAILTNNYWANWGILADLRTSIVSAAVSRLPEQLQTAYDLAKTLTPPSAEAIVSWQSIADQYHIPIVF